MVLEALQGCLESPGLDLRNYALRIRSVSDLEGSHRSSPYVCALEKVPAMVSTAADQSQRSTH